ncbi:glycosyl transferase family 1 [Soonwooa purpurea]
MKISKKVLIITYYWPPAGGPGVQRWLKFSKYLPNFGWQPIIYTPENPSYPIVDETLLKDIPENIEIVRTKIWEPYQLAEKFSKGNKKFKAGQFDVGNNQSLMSKLSIFVRGNFFIPDARKFWVKPSISFLKKYLEEHHIDCIVTTGPPHSLHLIGLGLKKEIPKLKWIADFRDPWTEISYYKHLKLTKSSDEKHRNLEKLVFQTADLTLATSYTDAKNFKKSGANAVCITNGFDNMLSNDLKSKTKKFTLSYIGVLEQLRNPENVWKALENLVATNPDFKNDFELKFVGRLDDKIAVDFEKSKLNKNIQNLGYLPHQKSFEEMQNSDLLLITNFPDEKSRGIIPGKLFEYLATGNSILSIGPKAADVERILNETQSGQHFDYQSVEEIKDFVLNRYAQWQSSQTNESQSNIEKFSRKNLTKELAFQLNQLVSK